MSEDCHTSGPYEEPEDEPGFHLHGKIREMFTRKKTVEHELNAAGTDCHAFCPACRVANVKRLEMRERMKYPPEPVVLTDDDRNVLAAARISW